MNPQATRIHFEWMHNKKKSRNMHKNDTRE